MFSRRTRTILPTADALLSTPGAEAAHASLTEAKRRQAAYHDRGAKERPPLQVGQPVRVKIDQSGDWRKAEVARKLPHRSYEVQLEGGTKLRRTSRHVRFTSEPPIIITDGGDDSPSAAPPASDPPAARKTNPDVRVRPAKPATAAADASVSPATVTRSGRTVKRPARYQD